MSKQLYEEALADVKKLKEVAEDNAKRALLEAVTPRIRDLIENQLIGELSQDEVEDDKLIFDDIPETSDIGNFTPADFTSSFDLTPSDGIDDAISLPDEEGKVTLDLDALKQSMETDQDVDSEDSYVLDRDAASALSSLASTTPSEKSTNISSRQFESHMRKIVEKVKTLTAVSKRIRESTGYSKALTSSINEVEDLYGQLQENFGSSPGKALNEALLENCYSTLRKLTEQKMKRNRFLNEEDVTLKLTGLPDEVELDDVGVDLVTGGGEDEAEEGDDEELDLDLGDEDEEESDEGEEEETKSESRRLRDNVVVEIDEKMLRREIGRMRALREAEETKEQSWGNGPGEVSDDFEDDDLGDPFVDVKLTTETDDMDEADDMDESDDMDELDELDQMVDGVQASKKKQDEADDMDEAEDVKQYGGRGDDANEQSNKQSRQVESIHRRLRAEARLQAEAKQKATQAKKKGQKSQKEAQQKQKEAKQKQNEAQQKSKQGQKTQAQQKKQESQKSQKEAQQKQKQAKQMKEAYVYFARKFNESVARSNKLRGMLSEATNRTGRTLNGTSTRSAGETSNLRAKLAETNLNNAKLAYANRLLQNESLTKRQKAEVLERLDEARTEREAKLVYESVTRSLAAVAPRQLAEGARVLGSASRATRTASTNLNEGFEADRWARLAGIVK